MKRPSASRVKYIATIKIAKMREESEENAKVSLVIKKKIEF